MNKIRGITVGILIIAALLVVGCSTASVPTYTARPMPTAKPIPTPAPALLEIVEWHWSHSGYGSIITEGLVKNISGHSMDSVLAEVTCYTADMAFVTSDWTFIDYQPIMAGQSSPFKIYTTDNPAISKASLSFRYFAGGTIKTK